MNKIYAAKNLKTNAVAFFDTFEELESFSKVHKYEFHYFSMPVFETFIDEDLFLEDGEDPSDYL